MFKPLKAISLDLKLKVCLSSFLCVVFKHYNFTNFIQDLSFIVHYDFGNPRFSSKYCHKACTSFGISPHSALDP